MAAKIGRRVWRARALLALLCAAGCAVEARRLPTDATLSETSYTNHYFGLTLALPSGWHVAQPAPRGSEGETRRLQPESPLAGASLRFVGPATQPLLTIRMHAGGAPESNPTFMVVAEPLAELPGLRSGMDYLAALEKRMDGGPLPITSWGDTAPLQLDRRPFFRKNFAIRGPATTLNQACFTAVEKEYVLGFVLSYASPTDWEALEPILRSIRFRP